MPQTNENSNYQEDEIDLRELFQTVYNKKIFIIIFTSIITILTIVYVLTKTPIFEAKVLLEIGNYKTIKANEKIMLEGSSQLSKKLNVLFIDTQKNIKNRESEITSIKTIKNSKDFLEIKSEALNNEQAIQEINKLLKYVKSEHKIILDEIVSKKEYELNDINREIHKFKNTTLLELSRKIKYEKESTLTLINSKIKNLQTEEINKINEAIKYINEVQKVSLNKKIDNLNDIINKDKKALESGYANLDNIKNNAVLIALKLSQLQYLENKIYDNKDNLINTKDELEKLLSQDLIEMKNQKVKVLNIDIPTLENQKNIINNNIKALETKKENMINMELVKLQENKLLLQNSMMKHNFHNTRIIGEIILNDYPIKPKKKLIVVVSFVTAFILAIFIVFFIEFIKSTKRLDENNAI